MVVYIEYVILDNLIIDSLVIICASKTIGSRVVWYRVLLASVVGTICAISIVYLGQVLALTAKIVCVLAMSAIANGKKRLGVHILLVITYTFLLGGIIIGTMSLLGIGYDIATTNMLYYSSIPISVYVAGVAMLVVLIVMIVQFVKSRRVINNYTCSATVAIGQVVVECVAYLDSGNTLLHQGVAVCFVFGKLYPIVVKAIADGILLNKAVSVPYSTVSGRRQAIAVCATVTANKMTHNVLLALSANTDSNQYDILLGNLFLEDNSESVIIN